MAQVTVTGLTATRMIEIEQASVVSGKVEGDDLVLKTKGGLSITAGRVKGEKGDPGNWSKEELLEDVTPESIGARPNTWTPAWSDVRSKPTTFPPQLGTTASTALKGTTTAQDIGAVKASGATTTVWSGTEAAYNALSSAEKNAVGFIGVITGA